MTQAMRPDEWPCESCAKPRRISSYLITPCLNCGEMSSGAVYECDGCGQIIPADSAHCYWAPGDEDAGMGPTSVHCDVCHEGSA